MLIWFNIIMLCHININILTAHAAGIEYNREDYKHWIDQDKDCQNTRHEVLIKQSIIEPKFDKSGCKVLSGKWYDPYTNQTYTDPSLLDIDHIVPLHEAHISGAYLWDKKKKAQYANDLSSELLIAVYKGANRSKGAKDPAQWLPINKEAHCDYIRTWISIKKRYNLSMDNREKEVVTQLTKSCFQQKRLK